MSSTVYELAKDKGLTSQKRWEEGTPHHPKSIALAQFLSEHDFHDYGDYFCWKTGGDGDNGETLMFQMDAYFEALDLKEIQDL